MAVQIKVSPYAQKQLDSIRREGEAKPTKLQGKRWRATDHCLAARLPTDALNPTHLKRNKITRIRAMHVGARGRVVWIASPEKNLAIVLMIGFVKEGDRGDTYEELERLLARGVFDEQFAELAIPKPGESEPPILTAAVNDDAEPDPLCGAYDAQSVSNDT